MKVLQNKWQTLICLILQVCLSNANYLHQRRTYRHSNIHDLIIYIVSRGILIQIKKKLSNPKYCCTHMQQIIRFACYKNKEIKETWHFEHKIHISLRLCMIYRCYVSKTWNGNTSRDLKGINTNSRRENAIWQWVNTEHFLLWVEKENSPIGSWLT